MRDRDGDLLLVGIQRDVVARKRGQIDRIDTCPKGANYLRLLKQ
ncbi:hypothetical protein SDC9_113971 [bioreactor metagenome]|uniref:Uncharacterized protein n=1 Tax=bioreactor metagenome TaxID=1076179 RepID=A0A645BP60_9ZZZZ